MDALKYAHHNLIDKINQKTETQQQQHGILPPGAGSLQNGTSQPMSNPASQPGGAGAMNQSAPTHPRSADYNCEVAAMKQEISQQQVCHYITTFSTFPRLQLINLRLHYSDSGS